MTPAEVDAVFRDSIVWDLDDAPPEDGVARAAVKRGPAS